MGRKAITEAAQGFMTALPDMVVTMDGMSIQGEHAVFRWTLTGTNIGPWSTGKAVRISGQEEWTIGADGLIAESKGHFDELIISPVERRLSQRPIAKRMTVGVISDTHEIVRPKPLRRCATPSYCSFR